MNEKTENQDKYAVVTVEDANKIKFAKVHRPERTKTIQTIDTVASRRPSINAPKRPEKKSKVVQNNVDIVSCIHAFIACRFTRSLIV